MSILTPTQTSKMFAFTAERLAHLGGDTQALTKTMGEEIGKGEDPRVDELLRAIEQPERFAQTFRISPNDPTQILASHIFLRSAAFSYRGHNQLGIAYLQACTRYAKFVQSTSQRRRPLPRTSLRTQAHRLLSLALPAEIARFMRVPHLAPGPFVQPSLVGVLLRYTYAFDLSDKQANHVRREFTNLCAHASLRSLMIGLVATLRRRRGRIDVGGSSVIAMNEENPKEVAGIFTDTQNRIAIDVVNHEDSVASSLAHEAGHLTTFAIFDDVRGPLNSGAFIDAIEDDMKQRETLNPAEFSAEEKVVWECLVEEMEDYFPTGFDVDDFDQNMTFLKEYIACVPELLAQNISTHAIEKIMPRCWAVYLEQVAPELDRLAERALQDGCVQL